MQKEPLRFTCFGVVVVTTVASVVYVYEKFIPFDDFLCNNHSDLKHQEQFSLL